LRTIFTASSQRFGAGIGEEDGVGEGRLDQRVGERLLRGIW
jgi:hypothetical protein